MTPCHVDNFSPIHLDKSNIPPPPLSFYRGVFCLNTLPSPPIYPLPVFYACIPPPLLPISISKKGG